MTVPDIHSRSLATSTRLMEYHVSKAILPSEVISILNQAGIQFVLVGTHGLGGWITRPRATVDVDVVVASRQLKRAVEILLKSFPRLEAADSEKVNRLRDRETQTVAIDVMKPRQPLFRVALKHTRTVTMEAQTYKIPTLEMALAMKFASMYSSEREYVDKLKDAHDFICMAKFNADIDLVKLSELGNLVHAEGGNELLEKVRRVRAGETFNL